YPNPFNPSTIINYQLPQNSKVELIIFNTLGQKIKTLVQKNQEAGTHHIHWNGLNSNNDKVSSGIYYYRLKAGKNFATGKMLLIK
ncbi:MAG: T9SS type A sorting domain-containing protein, partial [Calditrichia bacterium]|nr:T9SS type A sorting domain-containing protein [Calditrichia bacterium]